MFNGAFWPSTAFMRLWRLPTFISTITTMQLFTISSSLVTALLTELPRLIVVGLEQEFRFRTLSNPLQK